ncbi:recombinase family protein [Gracilibacillus caseinilyticus]|uniref:Recombinase family protein n=1 Tax=Gracilibacillus caseinilyticus TaxID=2932256 RepID=A0ABY4EYY3_9BACI|nr:recombinase family protein [Gracilibacillus caseinilyticus]UOQ49614.1 recombinase family protein [Gracilibacillus caseinilyticus]
MAITIGYIRVSTDIQLDGYSLDFQDDEINGYCNVNKFPKPIIFNEGSGSGSSIEEREVFREMLRYAISKSKEEKNEKIYVIVWKADRFARNLLDAMNAFNLLNKHGIYLISIAERLNTENESSIMMLQMLFMWAENERRNIVFNCKNGMRKRAEEGYYNGGKVFGYNSTPNKTLEINEEEAKIIRFIFDRYINERWGYYKIARFLNNQYTESRTSRVWDKQGIRIIVTNPLYAGYIRWREKSGDTIMSKGKHNAIISEEQWMKAQMIFDEKSYTPVKIHKGNYFLSGLLKCPDCNASMVQHKSSKGGKYVYYQCSQNKNNGLCKSNLVNKREAEEYVIKELSSVFRSSQTPQHLQLKITTQLQLDLVPKKEQKKLIKKDLKSILKRKNELFDLFAKKIISEEALGQQMKRLDEEEQSLSSMLDLLTSKIEIESGNQIESMVRNITDAFEKFFYSLDDIKQKEFLREYIERIDVKEIPKGKIRTKRIINKITYHFELEELSKLIA